MEIGDTDNMDEITVLHMVDNTHKIDEEKQTSDDDDNEDSTNDRPCTGESPIKLLGPAQIKKIADVVLRDEAHLFTSEEIAVFKSFEAMTNDAQELYISLLNRNPKWLRVSRLRYWRVLNIPGAIKELQTTNLIVTDGPDNVHDWLALLNVNDLKAYCKHFKIPQYSKMSRASLINAVMNEMKSQDATQRLTFEINVLEMKIKDDIGPVLKMEAYPRNLFCRLLRIYNRDLKWNDRPMTQSIIANMSNPIYVFPKYNVNRVDLVFPSRDEYLAFEKYLKIEFDLAQLMEGRVAGHSKAFEVVLKQYESCIDAWEDAVMNSKTHITGVLWLNVFTAGCVLTRIMELGCYLLGRLHLYERETIQLQKLLQQRLWRQSKRGSWYDRLALIHENYSKTNGDMLCWKICQEALQDSRLKPGHERAIQVRCLRVYKRLVKDGKLVGVAKPHFPSLKYKEANKVILTVPRIISEANKHTLWLGDIGEQLHVEDVALKHYKKEGWKGHHSENSILTSLFGMLFSDIILSDVPGVFVSEYQKIGAPLDLSTEYFYPARATLIERRLEEIDAGSFLFRLEGADDLYRPTNTRIVGVSWKRWTKEDILEVAECFGGPALSKICRLFAQSYRSHSVGVPDLCLWKYSERKVKLVEVKGKGDKFSDAQRVWLHYLLTFGIEAEECHINPKD